MPQSEFPDGWEIVGLHRSGHGVREVQHDRVTDRQVARADAIIVRYEKDTGIYVYRTIHGAKDKAQVGDLIDHLMGPDVSPV